MPATAAASAAAALAARAPGGLLQLLLLLLLFPRPGPPFHDCGKAPRCAAGARGAFHWAVPAKSKWSLNCETRSLLAETLSACWKTDCPPRLNGEKFGTREMPATDICPNSAEIPASSAVSTSAAGPDAADALSDRPPMAHTSPLSRRRPHAFLLSAQNSGTEWWGRA